MLIELKTVFDIYNEKDKLVKKNVIVKQLVESSHITNPAQVLNKQAKIEKNRCQVFIKDIGMVLLNHSYEEICRIKNAAKQRPKIGFI